MATGIDLMSLTRPHYTYVMADAKRSGKEDVSDISDRGDPWSWRSRNAGLPNIHDVLDFCFSSISLQRELLFLMECGQTRASKLPWQSATSTSAVLWLSNSQFFAYSSLLAS